MVIWPTDATFHDVFVHGSSSWDRFTPPEIKEDFEKNHENDKIQIYADRNLYATPASRGRYAVVWKPVANNDIEVLAVFPSQMRDRDNPEKLALALEAGASYWSYNRISLKELGDVLKDTRATSKEFPGLSHKKKRKPGFKL